MLMIANQLVLISHNFAKPSYGSPVSFGPNYGLEFLAINQLMHYLSTNNLAGTDYQLKPFQMTNWPSIH